VKRRVGFANVGFMALAKRERTKLLVRHVLAAVAIGAMFGFLGPFGTYPALDRVDRYAFWFGLTALGYASNFTLALAFSVYPRFAAWPAAARVVLIALAASIPMTFATTWALSQAQPGRTDGPGNLPLLFVAVASVQLVHSIAMALVAAHGFRRPSEVSNPSEMPRIPAFMMRVPLHLGRELVAVEGHDHYLRVHTRLGSDLILCRLADALGELADVDGLRVHRSWWVAGDAVIAMESDGDRMFVRLENALRVPVSRTYLSSVRKRGWSKSGTVTALAAAS
jgi:hypothetical protein